MVFVASILFAASMVLPSVMGLTLNTPANTAEDGTMLVTWTPAAGDPTFALLLDGPISIDAATGVNPTLGNTSVALGQVPPGTYTLQAVTGDAIGTVLSTSQSFQITAKAAGGAAAAAAAGGAAAAAAPAVAATGAAAAAVTAAPATAAAATAAAAGTAGKKGKGGAAAKAGAAAAAAKAGAAKAAAAKKAGAAKAGAKKGPRMVTGVKFGRRELYRD
jgi:hypothetical protein